MFDDDYDVQSSSQLIWRIINGIGCAFFLLCACVNFNDDDWYLWVTIYLLTSFFLAIEMFNYRSFPVILNYSNALLFCLLLAFGCQFLFKSQYDNSIKRNFLHREEDRELSGLALANGWLLLTLLNRTLLFHHRLSYVLISCGLLLTLVPVGMWSVCFVSDDWRQRFPQCHDMFPPEHRSSLHPTF